MGSANGKASDKFKSGSSSVGCSVSLKTSEFDSSTSPIGSSFCGVGGMSRSLGVETLCGPQRSVGHSGCVAIRPDVAQADNVRSIAIASADSILEFTDLFLLY